MTRKKTLVSGISWSAFERFSVQGMQLVIFICMARMLTPTDYGLVGMLTVFIVISQLLAEGGMSQAIIRKLDRNQTDCSTAFWANIVFGLLLYGLLFIIAPWIADFYGEMRLTALLRVLALAVVFQSSLVIHRSLLTAQLDFRTQAKSTLVGAILSGATGLTMAYNGYGAWSLVGLQITNQVTTGIVLWILSDWRPKMIFSLASFRKLFNFGAKIIGGKLAENLYTGLYSLFIGKLFNAYALGSYTNARQLGSISSENLTNIVQRASFPLFCTMRHDPELLRESLIKYIRLSAFFIAPLMLGLAAISEPLTTSLLGYQWVYTSRLLRILCPTFIIYPLMMINFMVFEIYGMGTEYLRLKIMSLLLGIAAFVVFLPFGLSAVCCGYFAASGLTYLIVAHISGRKIGVSLMQQIRVLIPIIANSMIMGVAMYAFQYIIPDPWTQIILCSIIGVAIYTILSVAFMTDTCKLLVSTIRRK